MDMHQKRCLYIFVATVVILGGGYTYLEYIVTPEPIVDQVPLLEQAFSPKTAEYAALYKTRSHELRSFSIFKHRPYVCVNADGKLVPRYEQLKFHAETPEEARSVVYIELLEPQGGDVRYRFHGYDLQNKKWLGCYQSSKKLDAGNDPRKFGQDAAVQHLLEHWDQ